MKKAKRKKKEEKVVKNNKAVFFWLLVIAITMPMIFTILTNARLDNDIWYLLSEGRYIVQHGIYKIDPLTIHEGLHVTVQNWASACLLWIVYSGFGYYGLYTLMVLCNIVICILLYKLCLLISDDNKILSILATFFTDLTLCTYYIVTRPQIFSFIVLLLLLYSLEKYIKTGNWKHLIALPILSIIEINMHASLWWMLWLYTLPYLLDSIKIPYVTLTQGYKKLPLIFSIAISMLVGLINPYGIKAITFIFTSYGDKYMHSFISELLPFNVGDPLCRHMAIIMISTLLLYILFRKGNVRFRYICLFFGTCLLGFMSVKGFSHFALVSLFPLTYFFKDLFPRTLEGMHEKLKKGFELLGICTGVICLIVASVAFIYSHKIASYQHDFHDVMLLMQENFKPEDCKIYSSFNNGGYVEFMGYKTYMDPRAELFLKVNNGKEDLFTEFYNLEHAQLNPDEFVKKYNFTHMLVEYGDMLSGYMDRYNYFVIYDNSTAGIRLYVRNDLFSDKERKKIVDAYQKMLKDAESSK